MARTGKQPSIADRLAAAQQYCASRGEQLTERRRHVLALLMARKGCVKAYELLAELQRTYPKSAPPAVYRPLHFLMAQGLVHRVESLNAYIACDSHEHAHHELMVVCPRCTSVSEVADATVSELLKSQLQKSGYVLQGTTVEINALCNTCAGVDGEAATEHSHKIAQRKF